MDPLPRLGVSHQGCSDLDLAWNTPHRARVPLLIFRKIHLYGKKK